MGYLLDIDIILPDFNEDVVRILCNLLEDMNPHVDTNIVSFNELNELIEVLNVTLKLSRMKVNDVDPLVIKGKTACEVKVEGLKKEELFEGEESFVKVESSEYIEEMPWKLPEGDEDSKIFDTPLAPISIDTSPRKVTELNPDEMHKIDCEVVDLFIPKTNEHETSFTEDNSAKDLPSSVRESAKSNSPNKVLEIQGQEALESTSKKDKESGNLLLYAHCGLTDLEEDTNSLRKENEELAKKGTAREKRGKAVLKNSCPRFTKNKELEKNKQEANNPLTVAENKHKQELAMLEKEMEDSRAGNEDMNKVELKLEKVYKLIASKNTEIETLKKKIAWKESVIEANKTLIMQQKIINRNCNINAVLRNARAIITKCEEENKQLEKELKDITSRRDSVESFKETLVAKRLEVEKAEALHKKVRMSMQEVAVQPPVSISPNVSSACGAQSSGQRMLSTIQPGQKSLDFMAQEFFPQARSASGEVESEVPPRAIVTTLKNRPHAANLAPGPSAYSTSGNSCTPADFSPSAPTMILKRPREAAPDSESQFSNEDRAAPSGYQKKAKGRIIPGGWRMVDPKYLNA